MAQNAADVQQVLQHTVNQNASDVQRLVKPTSTYEQELGKCADKEEGWTPVPPSRTARRKGQIHQANDLMQMSSTKAAQNQPLKEAISVGNMDHQRDENPLIPSPQ